MQSESNNHDRSAIAWALLIARVIVGLVFAAHGAQKLFGAFGGPGLGTVVQMMGPLGYLARELLDEVPSVLAARSG